MNVSVVGAGYVGLITACCLARSGCHVIVVENDRAKLDMLQQGIMPIYEKDAEEIFRDLTGEGKLVFTQDLGEAIDHAPIIIIAVGTPALPSGRADLSQVYGIVTDISNLARRELTVVMKSTVPPGTGREIRKNFLDKAQAPVTYVSNPEFIREGNAIQDWYNPDRIIIGSDEQKAAEQVMELYGEIDAPKIYMDITSAEMVKYASNAFLATKISFVNEIANLCDLIGADIDLIAPAVGMDKRIGSHFLKAGLGYGGSCFPKDARGLDYISTFNGYTFNLLKAVIEVNSKQRMLPIRKILHAMDNLTGKKIAVLGLAFKPFTDDVREAPAIDVIDQLVNERALVRACDPKAVNNARKLLPAGKVEFYEDPYIACKGCSAIILATEWPEYVTMDWETIKREMTTPYLLLDGRNALNKKAMAEMGFQYSGIGR